MIYSRWRDDRRHESDLPASVRTAQAAEERVWRRAGGVPHRRRRRPGRTEAAGSQNRLCRSAEARQNQDFLTKVTERRPSMRRLTFHFMFIWDVSGRREQPMGLQVAAPCTFIMYS